MLIILVGATTWYYFTFARLAIPAGVGMAAKHLCSLVQVSGLDPVRARHLYIDPFVQPLTPFLDVSHDLAAHTTVATGLGLWTARAVHRPGLGCTLQHSNEPLQAVRTRRGAATLLPHASPEEVAAAFDADHLARALRNGFTDETGGRNTLAIVVAHEGKVVAERYADGIDPRTPLPGWSMTKSVIATLLGILERQERVDVYAPGAISDWRGSQDPRAKISLDHLIRMVSGLEITEDQTGTDPNSEMLFSQPDGAKWAATRPLEAEPGTYWKYMSGNTVIVSRAIRELVGPSLQDTYDFVQRELFEPVGMTTAVLEADESGTFIGSSFMLASPHDWTRFGLLYLNRGMAHGKRIFSEDWVDYVTRHTPPAGETGYGAGFWLNRNVNGVIDHRYPQDVYYANGFQGQNVYIFPSKNLVITRLGATSTWGDGPGVAMDVLDAMK